MKEYWVNVYENYIIGDKHINRNSAIVASHITPIIYRIHVKIKEPKPKYDIMVGYKKIANDRHWMDN